jgi:glycosyltransferase involved in cell wall biosynthesis
MNNYNYILISPIKNEEQTIGKVIDSVVNQKLTPVLWIIVNDGSTDRSRELIEKKIKNLKWIKLINKKINDKYNWLGYSRVVIEGIKYCKYNNLFENLSISYLAILDSDITISNDYFYNLINFLKKNVSVGVVAGGIYVKNKKVWEIEYKNSSPRGGARIYNFKIFKEIDYFPNTPSPDRVSDIKIKMKGYKTISLENIKAFQHRKSFNKGGTLRSSLLGFFLNGRSRYIIYFSPLHVFLISIEISFKKRPYILSGLIFIFGYLTGFISKDKRIKDLVVRKYSNNFWQRIF